MKSVIAGALASLLAVGVTGAALADQVTSDAPSARAANLFSTTDVNLRSGPGTEHEKLGVVPVGQIVTLLGCLSGYRWCHVDWSGRRGWVYAKTLDRPRLDGRLASYAEGLGVPIVTFPLEATPVPANAPPPREQVITARTGAGVKGDRLDGPASFAADPNSDLLGGDVGLQSSVGR